MGTTTLKEGTDYTLSYKNNVKVGTATVTVTGTGAYTGTKSVTFKIVEAKKLPDVKAGSWYEKVVYRAVALGLMGGYDTGKFGPDDNVTRGQIAVMLWNMAGRPAAGAGAKNFPDVKSGAFYYAAVRWASSAGVVNGNADGTFRPNDEVTREQLAVMLSNYAKKVGGLEVKGSAADYASMKDAAKVSGYARAAVGWCFRSKILSGSNGEILPQGKTTRAQAAKMLVFLYDMLDK